MEKYTRILGLKNVSLKITGDHTYGFVCLYDKNIRYIQNIDEKIFWMVWLDDISFEKGRKSQYTIRFGPNPWFSPPASFRGGDMQITKEGIVFEDETEILIFSEELCQKLIQIQKEHTKRYLI